MNTQSTEETAWRAVELSGCFIASNGSSEREFCGNGYEEDKRLCYAYVFDANALLIARKFSELLRHSLGDVVRDIAQDNKRLPAGVCASHDYLDANEVMADAFQAVTGSEPDTNDEATVQLWNAAWTTAKVAEFFL